MLAIARFSPKNLFLSDDVRRRNRNAFPSTDAPVRPSFDRISLCDGWKDPIGYIDALTQSSMMRRTRLGTETTTRDDYVFLIDGREAGRYRTTTSGARQVWQWTVYGSSIRGAAESLDSAQKQFKEGEAGRYSRAQSPQVHGPSELPNCVPYHPLGQGLHSLVRERG